MVRNLQLIDRGRVPPLAVWVSSGKLSPNPLAPARTLVSKSHRRGDSPNQFLQCRLTRTPAERPLAAMGDGVIAATHVSSGRGNDETRRTS
jgi:hypothetical protein